MQYKNLNLYSSSKDLLHEDMKGMQVLNTSDPHILIRVQNCTKYIQYIMQLNKLKYYINIFFD